MNAIEKENALKVMKDLEDWCNNQDLSDEEMRMEIHRVFPSWKLCKVTHYHPCNNRGWQRCEIQVSKDGEFMSLFFSRYLGEYWK